MRGQGPLVLDVAVRERQLRAFASEADNTTLFHREECPAALQLAKSLLSSRCRRCSASLYEGPASSFQSRSTHGFNSAASSPRRTVVQYFSGSSTDIA